MEQNFYIDDFIISDEDMEKIRKMDSGNSLILDIPSLDEVRRLHHIRFEQ